MPLVWEELGWHPADLRRLSTRPRLMQQPEEEEAGGMLTVVARAQRAGH